MTRVSPVGGEIGTMKCRFRRSYRHTAFVIKLQAWRSLCCRAACRAQAFGEDHVIRRQTRRTAPLRRPRPHKGIAGRRRRTSRNEISGTRRSYRRRRGIACAVAQGISGTARAWRIRAARERAGGLHQLLSGRRGEPLRGAGRAWSVGNYSERRRRTRFRRLRHARFRPHAEGRAPSAGPSASDGEHHVAEREPSAFHARARSEYRHHTQGSSVP